MPASRDSQHPINRVCNLDSGYGRQSQVQRVSEIRALQAHGRRDSEEQAYSRGAMPMNNTQTQKHDFSQVGSAFRL